MGRRILSEAAAKNGIYLVFVVMLVVSILFAGGAHIVSSASALAATGTNGEEYSVDALLRQIELMDARMQSMETELDGSQQQNQHLLEVLAGVEDSFSIEYAGSFYATAYCVEEYPHICGGNGVTASGTVPTPGLSIAADWSVLPAGTWVYIDGVGMRRVEDTGSAIVGNRVDVAVDTHQNALRWGGLGNHDVWIITFNE